MVFDVRTIIFIIGLVHLIQVVVFFQQYKTNKNISGPGWWLLWCATEMFGFIFLLLRGIPSLLHYVIIIQNTTIILGTVFIYIGLLRFFEKKANSKILIPLLFLYILLQMFFVFVIDDINSRILILNGGLVIV